MDHPQEWLVLRERLKEAGLLKFDAKLKNFGSFVYVAIPRHAAFLIKDKFRSFQVIDQIQRNIQAGMHIR